jgi:hypothetical protein
MAGSRGFFCDLQLHGEPTHNSLQLGDPLLLLALHRFLLKEQGSPLQKLGLPAGQQLRVELMLSA